jgi:hypothetical protein
MPIIALNKLKKKLQNKKQKILKNRNPFRKYRIRKFSKGLPRMKETKSTVKKYFFFKLLGSPPYFAKTL